jgi:hypothetical protein
MRHYTEDDLILYHYGEAARPHRVAAHLEACESCRATYADITAALSAVNVLDVPDRDERYGLEVWQRVRNRLPAQEQPGWSLWFRPVMAAAVVMLMLGAFVAGRLTSPRSAAPTADPPDGAPAVAERRADDGARRGSVGESQGGDDRARLAAIGDHLEQSERVLLELLNANGSRIDMSGHQASAAELVDSNRLYRHATERAGDEATAEVLDELERHLLEIVHGPSTLTPAELEAVRVRLEAAALLFKVRILSDDLRERQLAPLKSGKRT